MAIGINAGDEELPQEGIGISSSMRERPVAPWVTRMNGKLAGARMMANEQQDGTAWPELVVGHGRGIRGNVPNSVHRSFVAPETAAERRARPGLVEYPQALPPSLVDGLAAFCVGIIATRPANQRIGRDGPYIDRWFLARKLQVPALVNDYVNVNDRTPRVSELLLPSELENLYLHRYARGDADVPHDHPWPNASLVVRGWYRESVFDARGQFIRAETRRPGDIVLRSAGSIHAITETSGDCLSLFATMRKERDWGFWRDGEFVPWREFK
jgi:hypothetical protein